MDEAEDKNIYANETRSVKRLFVSSLFRWWQATTVVALILPVLFVLSVLFEYTMYAHFPKDWAHIVQSIVGLLNIFFWSLGLYMLHQRWQGKATSYLKSFQAVSKQSLRLLGVGILYILAGVVIYGVIALITFILRAVFSVHAPLVAEILLLVAGLIYTFSIVLFFMAIPVVVLENVAVIDAFKRSIELSLKHWVRPFAVYLGVMVLCYLMLLPRLLASVQGVTHFHRLLIQALIGALLTPIIFNLILFVYNDLKLRLKLKLKLQQQRADRAHSSD